MNACMQISYINTMHIAVCMHNIAFKECQKGEAMWLQSQTNYIRVLITAIRGQYIFNNVANTFGFRDVENMPGICM